MSQDDRAAKFHEDALAGKGTKTASEIAALRKFLFRNQDYRFTEGSKTKLFQAVQLYTKMFEGAQEQDNPSVELLEDALKMPFTVFSTKQKKSMIKWLEAVREGKAVGGESEETKKERKPWEQDDDEEEYGAVDDDDET